MRRLRSVRPLRAVTNARRFLARQAKDLLLVAGVVCVAVAASYLTPAGPWLVVGLYLYRTGWTLSRVRRDT